MTTRLVLVILLAAMSGCGYRVGVKDAQPASLQSIFIPPFANVTTRYRLTDTLPGAIAREFLTRTRYRIVDNEGEADAVLRGVVGNYSAFPNVVDQKSGRLTAVLVTVQMDITLWDRKTNKPIWSRQNLEIRQRYEIAIDSTAYFEESDIALERVSREVARSVVSGVVEAF